MDLDLLLQLGVGGAFALSILFIVFQFILKWRNDNGKKNGNGNAVHVNDTKELKLMVVGIKDRQLSHDSAIESCMGGIETNQTELVTEQKLIVIEQRNLVTEQKATNEILRTLPKQMAHEMEKVMKNGST